MDRRNWRKRPIHTHLASKLEFTQARITGIDKYSVGTIPGVAMEDIIGERYGKLTVLALARKEQHPRWKRFVYYYLCECDCGTVKEIVRSNLITEHTRTCGCSKRRYGSSNPTFSGAGELGGYTWASIKHKAKTRNLDFSVTIEEAWELYEKQEGKCALTGIPLSFITGKDKKTKTASLDRIDNTRGYVSGNVQWVHKDVNWMKGVFTAERFFELCSLVTAHKTQDR